MAKKLQDINNETKFCESSRLGDSKHLEQPSTLKFDSNDNHIRGSD